MDIAGRHGLKVIEDAAHAMETTWKDRKIGTIGDITVFSFYPTKNISTGEGGMMTMMDVELGERVKRLSMHGNSKDAWKRYGSSGFAHYSLLERGYKYHMFDLIAAIGVAQFPKLERWYPIREKLWKRYDAAIGQMPGVRAVPIVMPGRHALHLYVIEIDPAVVSRTRDQLMDYLQANNVGVGIHYYGMHLQPYYAQKYGLTPEQFPNATRASERMLSLPLYPKMTLDDVDDVVAVLRAGIGA
ncbi:MAG: DegT/DnrJ/EryC1/StrS aminotransferase family protein, partial [Candidatus Eremiobacteraeota bacterium]|nr:DegT/DnrJ/EryC1/StrS aminotransferase family protein [Candidatus Eremiobacteraeota bacterium]